MKKYLNTVSNRYVDWFEEKFDATWNDRIKSWHALYLIPLVVFTYVPAAIVVAFTEG